MYDVSKNENCIWRRVLRTRMESWDICNVQVSPLMNSSTRLPRLQNITILLHPHRSVAALSKSDHKIQEKLMWVPNSNHHRGNSCHQWLMYNTWRPVFRTSCRFPEKVLSSSYLKIIPSITSQFSLAETQKFRARRRSVDVQWSVSIQTISRRLVLGILA